jgi:hypothetical protein
MPNPVNKKRSIYNQKGKDKVNKTTTQIQRSPVGMKMDTPVEPGYDGPDALFSIAECCKKTHVRYQNKRTQ